MAVNVEYIIKLRDEMTRKLKVTQDQVDKLNNKVAKSNKGFAGLGSIVGRLGIGLAIGAAAKEVVTLGANMEQTRIAFETFLGNKGTADQLIAQLNEFANVTPFNNEEIIKSGRLLLAAGIPAGKITDQLRQIGDVAAGANVPITELAAIFQKATNKGKLQAEELNQFSERGIPLLAELSKMFGKSKAEVLKLGEQGKITSQVMNQAFANMTGEGGLFFNLMEKQSKSLGGRFSTLVGKLQTVGIAIGEALIPVFSKIVEAGVALISFFREKFEQIKKVFEPLKLLFNPIIEQFTKIREQLKSAAGEGSILEKIFNAIGNALIFISPLLEALGSTIATIVSWISELVGGLMEWIKTSGTFQKVLAGVIKGSLFLIKNFVEAIKIAVSGIGNLLVGIFTLDIDKIKKGLKGVIDATIKGNPLKAGVEAAKGFKEGFNKGFTDVDFFKKQKQGAEQAGESLTGQTAGTLTQAAANLKNGTGKGDLKAGVTDVKAAAPKTFNINIDKLIEKFDISTTNLNESTTRIKEEVQKALITAITDASIISE